MSEIINSNVLKHDVKVIIKDLMEDLQKEVNLIKKEIEFIKGRFIVLEEEIILKLK